MKKSRLKKLVHITWDDHNSNSFGWRTDEEIAADSQPLGCETVGWLVKDGKDVKTVVMTRYLEENGFMQKSTGDMTILTCAIRKIKVLS
jgi:hypothetical protein